MANRVLRDWTRSEKMENLSFEAEVFFTRLIMKADDYGSYYANPKILKADLFPLKEIVYDQIGTWVHECIDKGLIFLYEAGGKEYIRIVDFGQRLRNMRSAFPHPSDNSQQVAASSSKSPPDIETETETETETESERAREKVFDKNVSRGTKTKLEIFEELFGDDIYVEQLSLTHKGKDLKQAFEECYTHHSNAPNPPHELWEWRQKLNTWLTNMRHERASKREKKQSHVEGLMAGFAARHGSDAGSG